MAYLDEQDRIRKQSLVTAQANGIVSKSNDVIETAEVFISQATPARDTTVRFGGPSDQEKSLTNISNKSALLTQKLPLLGKSTIILNLLQHLMIQLKVGIMILLLSVRDNRYRHLRCNYKIAVLKLTKP